MFHETMIKTATSWYFLRGQNNCNLMFYLTTKKVLGAFKLFLKILVGTIACLPSWLRAWLRLFCWVCFPYNQQPVCVLRSSVVLAKIWLADVWTYGWRNALSFGLQRRRLWSSNKTRNFKKSAPLVRSSDDVQWLLRWLMQYIVAIVTACSFLVFTV